MANSTVHSCAMSNNDDLASAAVGQDDHSNLVERLWQHLDGAAAEDLTLASQRALTGEDGSRIGRVASEILGKSSLPPEYMQRTLANFVDTIYLSQRRKRPRRIRVVRPKIARSSGANETPAPAMARASAGTSWRIRRPQNPETVGVPAMLESDVDLDGKGSAPLNADRSVANARQSRNYRLQVLRRRRQSESGSMRKNRQLAPTRAQNPNNHDNCASKRIDPEESAKTRWTPKYAVSNLAACLRTLHSILSESDSSQSPLPDLSPPDAALSFESSTDSSIVSGTLQSAVEIESVTLMDTDRWDGYTARAMMPHRDPIGEFECSRDAKDSSSCRRSQHSSSPLPVLSAQVSPVTVDSTDWSSSQSKRQLSGRNLAIALDAVCESKARSKCFTHAGRRKAPQSAKNRSGAENCIASGQVLTARSRLQARLKNRRTSKASY